MKALLLASDDALPYRVLRCATAAGCRVDVLGLPGTGRAHHLAWSRDCARYDEAAEGGTDEGLLAHVTTVVRERLIDLVLPSCAWSTRWLARHAALLPCPSFPAPASDGFEALLDPLRFAELCRGAGVPHPGVRLLPDVNSLERAIAAGEVRPPLVAKPLHGWAGRRVQPLRAGDPLRRLRSIDYAPVLVQEFIEGEDMWISVFCREGAIVASATHRYVGDAGFYVTLHDERAHSLAGRILARTGHEGAAGFHLRVKADGQACVIGCEPHFSLHADIAMLAGVNLVQVGLDALRGKAAEGELKAEPRFFLHARPLKPWTLVGEHGRLTMSDDPRLPLLIDAREAFGARVQRWMDKRRSKGSPAQALPAGGRP